MHCELAPGMEADRSSVPVGDLPHQTVLVDMTGSGVERTLVSFHLWSGKQCIVLKRAPCPV